MATSVTTDFQVGATVWHVSETDGVREAIVKSIAINIPYTGTVNMTTTYDVRFVNAIFGSLDAKEEDLFGDVDLALAEYKTRITT